VLAHGGFSMTSARWSHRTGRPGSSRASPPSGYGTSGSCLASYLVSSSFAVPWSCLPRCPPPSGRPARTSGTSHVLGSRGSRRASRPAPAESAPASDVPRPRRRTGPDPSLLCNSPSSSMLVPFGLTYTKVLLSSRAQDGLSINIMLPPSYKNVKGSPWWGSPVFLRTRKR